jgi:hypothetical protein
MNEKTKFKTGNKIVLTRNGFQCFEEIPGSI